MKSREVLKKIKENNLEVFTSKDLELLSGKKPYNIIKTLTKNKEIIKIKNGIYALQDDDMKIATRAINPSYISFLSALNFYNLTDQIPVKIQLATTKRKKQKKYDFTTIKKELFFGYTNIDGIIIAEREKAIIDSLYIPKKARGLASVKELIKNNLHKLNISKLKKYAKKDTLIQKRLKEVIE